jgi:hypothetical protein
VQNSVLEGEINEAQLKTAEEEERRHRCRRKRIEVKRDWFDGKTREGEKKS